MLVLELRRGEERRGEVVVVVVVGVQLNPFWNDFHKLV
jgi:hypothetical protein